MIIVIDEAIPYWAEAFSSLGEIRPFSARNPNKQLIRDADALIVRSITKVDAMLLDKSSVRFVGAASAGIDHIERAYLETRRIGFGYAPGCNANSVAEYVATALCVLASRKRWNLKEKSIAVIGVGNVGSRVAQKARSLGMEVLLCDPPLQELTGDPKYKSYEEMLEADFLSFHVPLTKEKPYPTFHMLNSRILNRLSPGQVLINSSRGAVFNNLELKTALEEKRIDSVILDVWEKEPQIDFSLLERIDIGTPHIAGSSLDGKIRATEMVCTALHEFFQIPSPWDGSSLFPDPIRIYPDKECTGQEAVLSVLLQAYNILNDDGNLRKLRLISSIPEAGKAFDRLRSEYRFRPEFRHFIAVLNDEFLPISGILNGLGFQVRRNTVT